MNLYPVLLISGLLALAGAALLMALGKSKRVARETEAGLEVLRSLRWKEFAGFATQLLADRGFKVSETQRTPGDGSADFTVEKLGIPHLLQVKHGGAYHVSEGAVRTLITMLAAHGAKGGILVTSGRFDAAAHQAARGHSVALIDGGELWTQLRERLPVQLRAEASERADDVEKADRKRSLLVGLAGVAMIGLGAAMWWMDDSIADSADATTTTTSTAAAPAPARKPVPPPQAPLTNAEPMAAEPTPETASSPPASTPAASTPSTAPATSPAPSSPASPAPAPNSGRNVEPTESELAVQRELAAAEVVLVDGVASASWPSRSTLLITLRQADPPNRAEILDAICSKVTARDGLRYTRMQVTSFGKAPNDASAVRWYQCR